MLGSWDTDFDLGVVYSGSFSIVEKRLITDKFFQKIISLNESLRTTPKNPIVFWIAVVAFNIVGSPWYQEYGWYGTLFACKHWQSPPVPLDPPSGLIKVNMELIPWEEKSHPHRWPLCNFISWWLFILSVLRIQLIEKEVKGNQFPASNPGVRIWGKLDNYQSP